MTQTIIKDDFTIVNDTKIPNVFTIHFNSPNKAIIQSISKIIVGGTITPDYKIFRFKAFSVKTFEHFIKEQEKQNGKKNLRVHMVAKLFMNLAIQLRFLIYKHGKSFIGYSPENIFVLDDNKFVYISNEHLTNIQNNLVQLTFPFSPRDFYLSPEQAKIKELPSWVHFKTAYYSLACLILHAFMQENELIENKETKIEHETWIKILDESFIKDTALYGILKRCLVEEPKERSIIFM